MTLWQTYRKEGTFAWSCLCQLSYSLPLILCRPTMSSKRKPSTLAGRPTKGRSKPLTQSHQWPNPPLQVQFPVQLNIVYISFQRQGLCQCSDRPSKHQWSIMSRIRYQFTWWWLWWSLGLLGSSGYLVRMILKKNDSEDSMENNDADYIADDINGT
jgi:hypothetical protein